MVEKTVHKEMYMVGIMLMRVQMMTHVETVVLMSKKDTNQAKHADK